MAISSFLGALSGGAIGGAIVNLGINDAGFKSGLAKAEAQTKTATGTMGSSFGNLKAVGLVALGGLAVGAVKFAGDAIAAAQEHEQAISQLTLAIKGDTTALQDQASALQMVTGFSDESILNADTILSRYKLTTTQLQELNPLILDFARAQGIDAAAAAGTLGKALLGNARAIKNIGGEFEATGDTTKDLAALMAILEDKVGGVAEEFGRTSEGQAQILGEKFNELQETVGKYLIPVLNALTQTLTWFIDNLPLITTLVIAFGAAWVAVNFGQVAAAISNIVKLLIVMIPQIVAANAATLGLGAAIAGVIIYMTYFSNGFKELSDAAGQYAADLAKTVYTIDFAKEHHISFAQAAEFLSHNIDALGYHFTKTGHRVQNFADLSNKALREFKQTAKDSFDSLVFDLSNTATQAGATRKEFIKASHAMQVRAEALGDAMEELSHAQWVPDSYIKFLTEQGPEFLIGFTRLNQQQQHQAVTDWKASTTEVDNAKGALDRVVGALGKLNTKKANPTITFQYKTEGDPALQQFLELSRTGT